MRDLAILLLLLGACAREKESEEARPAAGGVRLISAGAEPRSVVRYRPSVGKTRTLSITTGNIREEVEVRTPSLTQDGDARYEVTLRSVDDLTSPGSEDERRLRNAQGTWAAATVSRAGELRASEAPRRTGLRGLETWLQHAIVPFPQAAVGSGATWELDTDHGVARYELVAVDGKRAVVRFKRDLRTSDLATSRSTAEGQVTLDLTGPPAERFEVTYKAETDKQPPTTVTGESR